MIAGSRSPIRLLALCLTITGWVACGGGGTNSSAARVDAAAVAAPPPLGTPAYFVYVTNEMSGDLSVIDPVARTVVATIPIGKRPRGIATTADGATLFVALTGSPMAPPGVDESKRPPSDKSADGIGIVDAATRRLDRVVNGGSDPEQLAISRDGARLFVANENAGSASIVDLVSGKLAKIPIGAEPGGVTLSPDGTLAYVTSEGDGKVSVINTELDGVVAKFNVPSRPSASAFSPDGKRAYVTAANGRTVSVVDAAKYKVLKTITLTGENVQPMAVAVSPDGRRVYVTTGRGGTVIAIDAAANAPSGSVKVGDRPWGIAISPDGKLLYTANGPSNDVSVVDTDTLTVVATIRSGEGPWGIAVAPTPPAR